MDRFWKKVEKTEACWIWRASVGTHGYGQFSMNGRPVHAQRVAFSLAHGPVPAGMYVCHKCDNRLCVNPSHLFLGYHADNMQDMKAKGRAGFAARPGDENPLAKLTNEQAAAIRKLCADGASQRKAAAMFGVSQRAVWAIVKGRAYA